ncbi:hypothetical protein [Phenylobacterium sp.]|uniref:hypothetical protein n=1 Tax=Phenylobacterium sp. TaxID=1871053 RepID=UPI0039830EC8
MRPAPLLAALVLAAAWPATSQPMAPMLTVKEVMKHVVNPAAETFWKGSGSVTTEDGVEERAPTTDAAWDALVNAAAVVLEGGVILKTPGQGPADPEWQRFSQQLADAGALGMAAARAKDEDKVFEAGGEVYNACYACHAKYIPRPANSLWKQP